MENIKVDKDNYPYKVLKLMCGKTTVEFLCTMIQKIKLSEWPSDNLNNRNSMCEFPQGDKSSPDT